MLTGVPATAMGEAARSLAPYFQKRNGMGTNASLFATSESAQAPHAAHESHARKESKQGRRPLIPEILICEHEGVSATHSPPLSASSRLRLTHVRRK